MSTSITVRVNTTSNTGSGQDYQTVSGNYVDVDLANDRLIWSAGSSDVADGEASPTETELNEASTLITTSDVEVDKCFLDDDSTGLLDEIPGAGSGDDRYVFAFSFDGDTASEPTLEAWDDSDHDSTDLHVLGNGTPADSMVRAICTTDGTPGASWTGSVLSGASYTLDLNNGNGALGDVPSGQSTQELYANIKITVPASYAYPAVENWVWLIRFSWN